MLDFKRDATNPIAPLGHGRTLRPSSDPPFPHCRSHAPLAHRLLLDSVAAPCLGASWSRQGGKSAYLTPRSGSRLHLRLYLVLRQLLLDIPDNVSLRRARQAHSGRHSHPLLFLSRALSRLVWDANCRIPQKVWSTGGSFLRPIRLGRR